MRGRTLPLAGPIDQDPALDVYDLAGPVETSPGIGRFAPAQAVVRAMLDEALRGLPLGTYDEQIVGRLKGWDVSTVAVVASLLRRAFESGVRAGRSEADDERPFGLGWEQFPADCPSRSLRGVWHRDPDGDGDVLPTLYATPERGDVEFREDRLTPAQAREFARRLVEAADLAESSDEGGGDR